MDGQGGLGATAGCSIVYNRKKLQEQKDKKKAKKDKEQTSDKESKK